MVVVVAVVVAGAGPGQGFAGFGDTPTPDLSGFGVESPVVAVVHEEELLAHGASMRRCSDTLREMT